MSKTRKVKSLLIALVLIIALVPTLAYAGSWYTFSGSATQTTNHNTATFQNSGQPTITANFASSSYYRTYTIKLQRLTLSGTWEDVDQKSGSINAYSTTPVTYTAYITNTVLNTYRYNITISRSSNFDYTVKYYK